MSNGVWFASESGGSGIWTLSESTSGAPNAPTTVAGTATSGTTATITWVDASSDETGFQVQIRTAAGPGAWADAAGATNPTAAGVQTFSATGLTAATAYDVQVRAKGASSDSAYVQSASSFTTDNIGSGGGEIFVLADASHAHTADALVLTLGFQLAIQDATHAHAADSLALTSAAALTVADALHGHAADNIALQVPGAATLTVADAMHAHAADGLDLTSAAFIAVTDALHGHTADGLALTTAAWLAINDASHGHAVDNLALSLLPTLAPADALHAHTADALAFTMASWMAVNDALHAHRADRVSWSGDLAEYLLLQSFITQSITRASPITTAVALGSLIDLESP